MLVGCVSPSLPSHRRARSAAIGTYMRLGQALAVYVPGLSTHISGPAARPRTSTPLARGLRNCGRGRRHRRRTSCCSATRSNYLWRWPNERLPQTSSGGKEWMGEAKTDGRSAGCPWALAARRNQRGAASPRPSWIPLSPSTTPASSASSTEHQPTPTPSPRLWRRFAVQSCRGQR